MQVRSEEISPLDKIKTKSTQNVTINSKLKKIQELFELTEIKTALTSMCPSPQLLSPVALVPIKEQTPINDPYGDNFCFQES
jgi:hypothetical protein